MRRLTNMSKYAPPPSSTNAAFVHESFPPGNKLGTPRLRHRPDCSERNDHPISVFVDNASSRNYVSKDRNPLNVSLPRLPFDNSPLTPRKSTNCSFISNHKTYLRLKGLQVKDVYSLNRQTRDKVNQTSLEHNSNSGGSTFIDLPSLFNGEKNNWLKKRRYSQKDVWKPSASRKLHGIGGNEFYMSLRELDRELDIPGHLRPDDVNSMRLGKVLSNSRLQQLLTQEEPVIPKAFYGVLSPRIDTHRSLS